MAKNFTHNPIQHPDMNLETGYDFKVNDQNSGSNSPSITTISKLLNYSKALVMVPNKITGEYHALLMN